MCRANPGVDRSLHKYHLLDWVYSGCIENRNVPSTHAPILFPSLVSIVRLTLWHTVAFLIPTFLPLLNGNKGALYTQHLEQDLE